MLIYCGLHSIFHEHVSTCMVCALDDQKGDGPAAQRLFNILSGSASACDRCGGALASHGIAYDNTGAAPMCAPELGWALEQARALALSNRRLVLILQRWRALLAHAEAVELAAKALGERLPPIVDRCRTCGGTGLPGPHGARWCIMCHTRLAP